MRYVNPYLITHLWVNRAQGDPRPPRKRRSTYDYDTAQRSKLSKRPLFILLLYAGGGACRRPLHFLRGDVTGD